ncbi:Iroquois-class homeodomain protein irx-3 [Aphelenchoides avenae]|nr:Iroquois-class homeodomain protein irx-3 [Aphelenchus avenae]
MLPHGSSTAGLKDSIFKAINDRAILAFVNGSASVENLASDREPAHQTVDRDGVVRVPNSELPPRKPRKSVSCERLPVQAKHKTQSLQNVPDTGKQGTVISAKLDKAPVTKGSVESVASRTKETENEAKSEAVPMQAYLDALTAIADGRTDDLRRLIDENKGLVNYAYDGSQKYTCLHIAARMGDLPSAKLLIRRGAELNMLMESWSTPLHLAAQNGKREMINLLRTSGADESIRDAHGHTYHYYLRASKQQKKKPTIECSTPDTSGYYHSRMGSIRRAMQGLISTSANLAGIPSMYDDH